MKMYFNPFGKGTTSVLCYGFPSRSVSVSDDGEVDEDGTNDAPNLSVYTTTDDSSAYLLDDDGNEFLERHCRLVEVYAGFEPNPWNVDPRDDDTSHLIEAWSDEAVLWCSRIAALESGLVELKRFEQFMPNDWRNPITAPIMDHHITGPILAEIGELETKLAAYRATRTEVEQIEDPADEQELPVDGTLYA